MTVAIKRAKDIPNETDVVEFEGLMKITLPNDFRMFVTEFGAAVPDVNVYENYNEISVRKFISINSKHSIKYYLDLINSVDQRMPRGFLPIAEDGSGNYFCLNSADGSVWFWTHDLFAGEDPNQKLADNFGEFLRKLQPVKTTEVPTISYRVAKRK